VQRQLHMESDTSILYIQCLHSLSITSLLVWGLVGKRTCRFCVESVYSL
jgi:hypothetical protein